MDKSFGKSRDNQFEIFPHQGHWDGGHCKTSGTQCWFRIFFIGKCILEFVIKSTNVRENISRVSFILH